MIKLSTVMTEALHFYSEDHTHEAVAFPRTGTRVALIRRGLLTTGLNAWDHELTADGWAFLRSGQTVDEAHEMAAEINTEITRGIREGQNCLDTAEQRLTEQELAERIAEYAGRMTNSVAALELHRSRAVNGHALRIIRAHAFWLGVYRAERDRRSRLAAVDAHVITVATMSPIRMRPLTAVMDLLHGEALEQYRTERHTDWARHMIQPRDIIVEIGLGQDLQLHSRVVTR